MSIASALSAALFAATVVEPSPWGDVSVQTPEIPERDFPITAYSNDVNAAMSACAAAGGVENVYMRDCRATGKEVYRLMYLKTNERRGGFMRRIMMERCTADSLVRAAFAIDTDVLYQWANLPTYEVRPSEIDDVVMKDCEVGKAECRYSVRGDARRPVGKVTLDNVHVLQTTGKDVCEAVSALSK